MPSFSSNIHLSSVLKALTRKFKLSEDVSLYSIAKKCPPNFSGADMYALCADAWFQAAKREVKCCEDESISCSFYVLYDIRPAVVIDTTGDCQFYRKVSCVFPGRRGSIKRLDLVFIFPCLFRDLCGADP